MHAESVLEFDALRALVGRFVRSPLGRAELDRVEPVAERPAIEAVLADTAEAVAYVQESSGARAATRGAAIRVRFDLAVDPAPLVARLRIDGALLEPQ